MTVRIGKMPEKHLPYCFVEYLWNIAEPVRFCYNKAFSALLMLYSKGKRYEHS